MTRQKTIERIDIMLNSKVFLGSFIARKATPTSELITIEINQFCMIFGLSKKHNIMPHQKDEISDDE